jgi:hypothetical protein
MDRRQSTANPAGQLTELLPVCRVRFPIAWRVLRFLLRFQAGEDGCIGRKVKRFSVYELVKSPLALPEGAGRYFPLLSAPRWHAYQAAGATATASTAARHTPRSTPRG